MSKKAVVISDPQCKPGVDMSYMSAIGNYIAAKRPDYIIHIGDHWDFPSLSSYDKGKRAAEGRRLADDIAAGNKGMDMLLHATNQMQRSQRANKKKVYNPRMVFCVGNHECLTEHSEVLTKEGFKHYKDLLPTDQVLTLTDSMKQEWNTPELVFEKDYKGKLISYESSCFSSLTTPGHRLYYTTFDNPSVINVSEAKDMPDKFILAGSDSSKDCSVVRSEVDYEGKVWCMKVKNENFFIRHNNKCHFTGNCRLDRMADDFPELHDTLGIEMLNIEQWGWEVYDFLKPAVAEGIAFMHYLPNPFTGKPYGGTAMSQLKNVGCSFVVGHKQTLDVAIRPTLDGNMQLGVICGASYDFDEDYKGYTGNTHFRGITVLHEMENGFALPMFVSTQYLKKNYL